MTNTQKSGEIGFTLAEVAIVLLIVGILLAGMLTPLGAQVDLKRTSDTQKALEDVKEALIGFAIRNGRLPLPAATSATGVEAAAGTVCTAAVCIGFVPGVALGLTPVDGQGYVLDAWNNRIRYAVTTSNSNAFTTAGGMRTVGLGTLSPDLKVCSSATCSSTLVSTAPAVIYSLGPNGATGGSSTDEAANVDTDAVFVSHPRSAAAGNEFDDIVVWLSPNVLYNRMVAAGQLP
jgi:type II secretory pathway pseudopilin PulG